MSAPQKVTKEVRKLVAEASQTADARKHHLVPSSYLERWAINGQVRVTETSSRSSYRTSPRKAARETDFYRLDAPGLDPTEVPPLLFEVLLSKIEGNAVPAIDHLVEKGPEGLKPDDGAWLATYLAFQLTRGRSFRSEQRAAMEMMLRLQHPATPAEAERLARQVESDPSPERVEEVLKSLKALHDRDVRVEPGVPHMISMAGQMAEVAFPQLLWRDWFVFWTDIASLITCDEPVLLLEGPDADRRRRGGIGTADALLFPLAPNALLAMFHPDHELSGIALWPELDAVEVSELNREIGGSSHRWMFERSDRSAACTLSLPPLQPDAMLRGPLKLVDEPDSQLFNIFRPSRWYSSAETPALPVKRWWTSSEAAAVTESLWA